MPLGAILDILSDTKSGTQNPLASEGALYRSRLSILTINDFQSFKKIKESDITDDFLGFFSLLTSYCALADFTDPKQGPKHLLPVMPRTDFVTQYNTFIQPKLAAQLSQKKTLSRKLKTSLYDIVETVSGVGDQLAEKTFKWKVGPVTEVSEDWIGKAEDLEAGTLEVQKFLNYLQGYDPATKTTLVQMDLLQLMDKALRHGQIGGYGSKMETILGTSKLVPIFEFRELQPVKGPALSATMGSYEDKVIAYHEQFASTG